MRKRKKRWSRKISTIPIIPLDEIRIYILKNTEYDVTIVEYPHVGSRKKE